MITTYICDLFLKKNNASFQELEKRGRLRNFLKSGGGSTSSSRKNSSGVNPQESESENKSKQRGNSCSRSNTPNSKQRSKSAHTGIATAFKVNWVSKMIINAIQLRKF